MPNEPGIGGCVGEMFYAQWRAHVTGPALMTSQFASQTLSLGQVLANPYLIDAPPYQRAFAWTSEEAGTLLDDLVEALDAEGDAGDSPDYFLGTMLFIDKDHPSSSRLANWPRPRATRNLEVVDGLQRLTTLTILFSVMSGLDAAQGKQPSERVLAAIRTGQGAARPRLALREADEKFFEPYVRAAGAGEIELPGEPSLPARERMLEVRAHFIKALADYDAALRRRLADFLLDKCFVVLVATRNIDRAHRMFTVLNTTGKPLARNDILKASLLGRLQPAALARATVAWDEAETRLGEDFDALFSHVRVLYGRASAPVISGVVGAADGEGADAFIERVLRPAAIAFDDIRKARHSGSPHSAAISRSLAYLGWLPAADWVPPAMLWWVERGGDAAELAWFLGRLDRLAYGVRILGLGTKKRANRLGGVVAAIRNRQDLKAPGSPLGLTREEARTISFNLRDLHKRSAPMAKLLLLRLNDQIAGKPQSLPIKDLTVEHLLPRKPSASSEWRRWFTEPGERERWTESLGNLVLVTRAQNDKAGNLDFERKKAVLFDTPGVPALPVNEYVRRQSEWKVEHIQEREADLLWHLYELWQIGEAPSRSGDADAA
jgi:hypothetical protein